MNKSLASQERLYENTAMNWITKEHKERYEFACSLLEDLKVLDVASGSGYGSKMLSKKNKVIGLEFSKEAVEYSIDNYGNKNCIFIQGDAQNMPFKDNNFDAVVSFETIEHLENPSKFISEVLRVLKKKGILILSTPNKRIWSPRTKPLITHHIRELHYYELMDLTVDKFDTELYGQHFTNKSIIYLNNFVDFCFGAIRWFPYMKQLNRMIRSFTLMSYYKFENPEGIRDIYDANNVNPSMCILIGRKR